MMNCIQVLYFAMFAGTVYAQRNNYDFGRRDARANIAPVPLVAQPQQQQQQQGYREAQRDPQPIAEASNHHHHHHHQEPVKVHDFYAYPKYSFDYTVKDHYTRDLKNHWENRDGDRVWGQYSLVEPDGNIRVVDYWSDDKHGFHALVSRKGPQTHPKPHHHHGEQSLRPIETEDGGRGFGNDEDGFDYN